MGNTEEDLFPHVVDEPRRRRVDELRQAVKDNNDFWSRERKRLDGLIASGAFSKPGGARKFVGRTESSS